MSPIGTAEKAGPFHARNLHSRYSDGVCGIAGADTGLGDMVEQRADGRCKSAYYSKRGQACQLSIPSGLGRLLVAAVGLRR